ncbi:MAG TPA: sigma 54-interacting transcriptional regulator [Polyangia bacterium]|nr:sigma 54-interacting transcriptional regulator [Polyangia bacterium]
MALVLREQLLGTSAPMVELRERVKQAAAEDSPVLIEGERGTGRERVARLLHEIGPRKNHDFVRVDPDEDDEPPRVEAELERANGGTLLVKEIAHVGRGPQRKLLRAIKRGPGATKERERSTSEFCDVRVIAATGVDLSRAVADELFDPELYERLGALRISLPPLRRRPEDVPLLLEHFGRCESREIGGDKLTFNSRAMDKLTAYSWPGNVAELRDVVRRLCLRRRKSHVELSDVEAVLPPVEERVPVEQLSFEEMVRAKIRALLQRMEGYPIEDLYEEVISRVERPLIELVLERTGNNQLKAAEILGLNRNTLRKKIAERNVAVSEPAPSRKK